MRESIVIVFSAHGSRTVAKIKHGKEGRRMSAIKITLQPWHYTCEDGCCDEYGTALYVDGKEITRHFDADESDIKTLLDAIGVNYEIEMEWEAE
jgi:hypothetical protein